MGGWVRSSLTFAVLLFRGCYREWFLVEKLRQKYPFLMEFGVVDGSKYGMLEEVGMEEFAEVLGVTADGCKLLPRSKCGAILG
jgi:hypothetical protein